MNSRRWMVLLWVAMAACMAGAARSSSGDAATPIPSPGDLRELVQQRHYREALKGLTRLLELKDAAASGFDRHEMLMLRAECLLQIGEAKAAISTLVDAKKEAEKAEREADAAQAVALAYLVHKSPGNIYLPRS